MDLIHGLMQHISKLYGCAQQALDPLEILRRYLMNMRGLISDPINKLMLSLCQLYKLIRR